MKIGTKTTPSTVTEIAVNFSNTLIDIGTL